MGSHVLGCSVVAGGFGEVDMNRRIVELETLLGTEVAIGNGLRERLGTAESLLRDLAGALQSFPKLAPECAHDAETDYCVCCHAEFDAAVADWIMNDRTMALSRIPKELQP